MYTQVLMPSKNAIHANSCIAHAMPYITERTIPAAMYGTITGKTGLMMSTIWPQRSTKSAKR